MNFEKKELISVSVDFTFFMLLKKSKEKSLNLYLLGLTDALGESVARYISIFRRMKISGQIPL